MGLRPSGEPCGAAPVAPAERSRFLDVLRGIAILGILPANIPLFGLPSWAQEDPTAAGGGTAAELATYATWWLVDYKFITLFSILFGVGMVVMRGRPERPLRAYAPVMIRRMVFVGAVGLAHAAFLFDGDILTYYAVLGLLLCWASAGNPGSLQRVGWLLVAVPAVYMAVEAVGIAPGGEPAWDKEENADVREVSDTSRTWTEGTFAEISRDRFATWWTGFVSWGKYFGWRIGGLFLVGMAWARAGWFLRPQDHRARFRWMALGGLAFGLLVNGAACLLWWFEPLGDANGIVGELALYVGSLGLSIGYAGVVGVLTSGPLLPAILKPFEAAGRMAFTNYLLQSAICSLIFCSYGLGLYGSLDRAELWLVVLGVWAVNLLVSALWMRRFRFGPMEWIWRAATYWKAPPLRA